MLIKTSRNIFVFYFSDFTFIILSVITNSFNSVTSSPFFSEVCQEGVLCPGDFFEFFLLFNRLFTQKSPPCIHTHRIHSGVGSLIPDSIQTSVRNILIGSFKLKILTKNTIFSATKSLLSLLREYGGTLIGLDESLDFNARLKHFSDILNPFPL